MNQANHMRKRRYIDRGLQGRLIVALLVLEGLLLLATLYWLHGSMAALIEDQLFRVHQTDPRPLFQPLLEQAALGVGVMLAVNVALLLLAESYWTGRIKGLLAALRPLLTRSEALDFAGGNGADSPHATVELARSWRQAEAERLGAVRQAVQGLDAQSGADPAWRDRQRGGLGALLGRLPVVDDASSG